MRDHRTELFSVEIPVSEDTPRLVRRIERISRTISLSGLMYGRASPTDEETTSVTACSPGYIIVICAH